MGIIKFQPELCFTVGLCQEQETRIVLLSASLALAILPANVSLLKVSFKASVCTGNPGKCLGHGGLLYNDESHICP